MAEGQEFSFVQFSRTSRPMVSTAEKSRVRRTINDAPLPKVNWYLFHICFLLFSNFVCTSFVLLLCMFENFQNCFLHAGIFLAIFPFHKNTKNNFWVLKSFGKSILDILSSKLLAVHHIFKVIFCLQEFFLHLFPFYKKIPKIFFEFQNPLEINLKSFQANF